MGLHMNVLDGNREAVEAANSMRLYGRGKVQKDVLVDDAVGGCEEGKEVL